MVGKFLATDMALKLAYSSVDCNMSLQIWLVFKTLSTVGTVISIDPLVQGFDMLLEVAYVAETSVAQLAKWPLVSLGSSASQDL